MWEVRCLPTHRHLVSHPHHHDLRLHLHHHLRHRLHYHLQPPLVPGRYTFSDSAFAKAGMVVVVAGAGAAGAALLARLQPQLHFLSFGVQLRGGGRDGEEEEQHDDASSHMGPPAVGGAEQIHLALHALSTQHNGLLIRALVGHGAAADACLAYAGRYGHVASCPVRRLALLGGKHAHTPPPSGWSVLSVHGAEDAVVPRSSAELWHVRHRGGLPHALRVLAGADHAFATKGAGDALAAALNDWLEGARRLSEDDSADAWRTPTAAGGAAQAEEAAEDDDDELFGMV